MHIDKIAFERDLSKYVKKVFSYYIEQGAHYNAIINHLKGYLAKCKELCDFKVSCYQDSVQFTLKYVLDISLRFSDNLNNPPKWITITVEADPATPKHSISNKYSEEYLKNVLFGCVHCD